MPPTSYRFNRDELKRLSAQAEIGYRHERPFYEEILPEARQVVDFGSGNGVFTGILASHFPHTRFTGVEVNPELFAMARNQETSNLSFLNRSLLDREEGALPPAEVVNLRFVLQHIRHQDWEKLFSAVGQVLTPGGTLLVTDFSSSSLTLHRPIPQLHRINRLVSEYFQERGFDRDIGAKIPEILDHHGYRPVRVLAVNANSFDLGKENFFNLVFSFMRLYREDLFGAKEWADAKAEYDQNCSFAWCTYLLFAAEKKCQP